MNESLVLARELIAGLVAAGVKNFVISPGSRSAPLAMAVAYLQKKVNLQVRVDERSAGFLALGLALKSQTPTVVIVTSGTAVANLFPAVVEASYSQVPLLLLTADRPTGQVALGASQTIEQKNIFGKYVRQFIDLESLPSGEVTERYQAIREALTATMGLATGIPGPVQINVKLAPPLVDEQGGVSLKVAGAGFPDISLANFLTQQPTKIAQIDLSLKTLVISGYNSGYYPELADCLTVAEPESRQKGIPFNPLLVNKIDLEQVIICGRVTLHRPVAELLNKAGIKKVYLSKYPSWLIKHSPAEIVYNQVKIINPSQNLSWLHSAKLLNRDLQNYLSKQIDASQKVTGLRVATAFKNKLTKQDNLVLAASNTIRDIALAGQLADLPNTYSNRGVAGIDGFISTAVGISLASPSPSLTIAMTGDLSFLHDINGLLIGPAERWPERLIFLVINDNGGGIFRTLEYGDNKFSNPKYDQIYNRVMRTQTRVDFAKLLAGYAVKHQEISLTDWANYTRNDLLKLTGISVMEIKADSSDLNSFYQQVFKTVAQLEVTEYE